jgi:hypothetical protein
MQTQEKSTIIDKDYVPQPGDVLSNDEHSLIIIEQVYSLNKTSLRVNRNYNDHVFKYELLQKVIRRREAIWNQHKNDFKLFPDPTERTQNRDKLFYHMYLYYNDYNRYERLYMSKYSSLPTRKNRVVIGQKTMVRANHIFCELTNANGNMRGCNKWYGKYATPLTYLINKKFVFQGNIRDDFMLGQNES